MSPERKLLYSKLHAMESSSFENINLPDHHLLCYRKCTRLLIFLAQTSNSMLLEIKMTNNLTFTKAPSQPKQLSSPRGPSSSEGENSDRDPWCLSLCWLLVQWWGTLRGKVTAFPIVNKSKEYELPSWILSGLCNGLSLIGKVHGTV